MVGYKNSSRRRRSARTRIIFFMPFGYKIVRNHRYRYCSVIMYMNGAGVVYNFNIWSIPNTDCGSLCVFKDYASADKFGISKYDAIFRCEYEEDVDGNVHDANYSIECLPPGTVLASKVKLLF